MIVRSISAAKAQLSALIEKAQTGEEIVIGKAGKPVAILTKYAPEQSERAPGSLKGQIRIADDFDTLPHDLAAALGVAESRDAYGTAIADDDS